MEQLAKYILPSLTEVREEMEGWLYWRCGSKAADFRQIKRICNCYKSQAKFHKTGVRVAPHFLSLFFELLPWPMRHADEMRSISEVGTEPMSFS